MENLLLKHAELLRDSDWEKVIESMEPGIAQLEEDPTDPFKLIREKARLYAALMENEGFGMDAALTVGALLGMQLLEAKAL